MKRAIIFANGELRDPAIARNMIQDDDLIVAADNGAARCKRLGITPHVIIGDMDSIAPELLAEYEKKGAAIIRHPADKNETDLELALAYARSIGVKEIIVFCVVGDRWDMTIASALMLAHASLHDISIRAIHGIQELIVVHAGRVIQIHGAPGDIMSLIPLTDRVEGITLEGFQYPLNNATLTAGATRGLSNELSEAQGIITLTRGSLLCFHTHYRAPTPLEQFPTVLSHVP